MLWTKANLAQGMLIFPFLGLALLVPTEPLSLSTIDNHVHLEQVAGPFANGSLMVSNDRMLRLRVQLYVPHRGLYATGQIQQHTKILQITKQIIYIYVCIVLAIVTTTHNKCSCTYLVTCLSAFKQNTRVVVVSAH